MKLSKPSSRSERSRNSAIMTNRPNKLPALPSGFTSPIAEAVRNRGAATAKASQMHKSSSTPAFRSFRSTKTDKQKNGSGGNLATIKESTNKRPILGYGSP